MKYLVFDLGGTFIKYGIVDSDYEILFNEKFETPKNKESFLNKVKEVYLKYENEIEGVALSMPGHIDEHNGFAHNAGLITYLAKHNIVALLNEFINKPISVENDGKCAALSELWLGSLKDVNHGVALVFGSGVGGGIIINKKVYKGFSGIAGEFSFIAEKISDQKNDLLGRLGSVSYLINEVSKCKNIPCEKLDGEKVFKMVEENDEDATKCLKDFCDNIVRHIYNIQHILDPEKFSIGGGISNQKIFIDCLRQRIDAYGENNFFLKKPLLVQSKYKNNSNILGALINYHINNIKKVG